MTAAAVVEGLAAPFGQVSRLIRGAFTEIIAPGAFTATLAAAAAGRRCIEAVSNHRAIILGSTGEGTLRLWEDDTGLRFTLTTRRLEPITREAMAKGNHKVSVLFNMTRDEWGRGRTRRAVYAAELIHVAILSGLDHAAYDGTWARIREARKQ